MVLNDVSAVLEERNIHIHEQEAYSELDVTLTDEQKKLMDRLGEAQGETSANQTKLTYQQGMKDMYSLILSLRDIADRR